MGNLIIYFSLLFAQPGPAETTARAAGERERDDVLRHNVHSINLRILE